MVVHFLLFKQSLLLGNFITSSICNSFCLQKIDCIKGIVTVIRVVTVLTIVKVVIVVTMLPRCPVLSALGSDIIDSSNCIYSTHSIDRSDRSDVSDSRDSITLMAPLICLRLSFLSPFLRGWIFLWVKLSLGQNNIYNLRKHS